MRPALSVVKVTRGLSLPAVWPGYRCSEIRREGNHGLAQTLTPLTLHEDWPQRGGHGVVLRGQLALAGRRSVIASHRRAC